MNAAIGIGSNLGDSPALIRRALEMLEQGGLEACRVSTLYRTVPVDCVPGTPPFLNGAVTGRWKKNAGELLALCKRIERRLGRPRVHSSREARTIDLDLLLFGDRVLRDEGLNVPHPRLGRRLFVLAPLAEIAGDWRVPPQGTTVLQLLEHLVRELGPDARAVGIQPLGQRDEL
ncbi:MAG: 2-amino-4-hydroxy-6-hydroxymethyldihydropteridine diphosphokinase [Kiritimatiellaeota bacterium]|nr:2-amino-4-hydroxy-6-hydroxymethyldihydropteridine diphosphokinase [Kiritimatiellota bacterium]